MDHPSARLFFQQPTCPSQRQYEALRAVFLEGISQKEAARRFGYSYPSFRQLVGQFRAALDAGQPPPFLPRPDAAALQPRPRPPRRAPRRPPWPTPAC